MTHNITLALRVMTILCFITATAYSQTADTLNGATLQEKVEAITLRMERELALTKPQSTQAKKVLTDRLQSLERSPAGDADFDAVNKLAAQKLAGILTDKQYTLYQELRSRKKQEKDKYLKEHPGFTFSKEDIEMDF